MNPRHLIIQSICCFLLSVLTVEGQHRVYPASNKKIIVAADGTGDFRSVQGAINSLPDSSSVERVIFICIGTYREKIYLEKNNIVLEGEDRELTIITASIARDEWRCAHRDDWGVATLNVGANDISLINLTIINDFGFTLKKDEKIPCAADTITGTVTLRKSGHQMALRTMNATRLKAINCRFSAFGGDTVSPWNVEYGMWYFKDCIMEGGVDFYCPRGWAYAENCVFIALSGSAAIWHDGSANQDSKTVLVNCSFNGFDGFNLGRFHRDAQFMLINCRFADNMADRDIYLVPTNNIIQWGRRVYYYNSKRINGKDFSWHQNNFPAGLSAKDITPNWVFKDLWNPEKNLNK